jgi:predicted metalloprotease with PDZ domain
MIWFCALAMGVVRPLCASALPVRYLLDLREPDSHLVQVTMTIPGAPAESEVQIPTWNNLYQIRDFVRGVQQLEATCEGQSAELARVDLNTWRGPDRPCFPLELRYAVYANDESPFSSVLNGAHAFLNFALLLFYLPKDRGRPVQVNFLLPNGWKLATLLEGEADHFHARDYDALVDSPAEAGHFQEYNYTQDVKVNHCRANGDEKSAGTVAAKYRVVVDADPRDYSPERLLDSLEKITATETAMMQDVPFNRYTFIFHFLRSNGAGGGMEHANGTAITLPAAGLQSNWRALESMAAHELFHAWNAKRIRPQLLEPIDYIHENDTRDLWFCEGVTSTFAEYALLRGGVTDSTTFYERLAGAVTVLQSRPARFFQSVETSGREAWLEKYADYLRPERSISYYNKGELLGFMLDLGIRHATHNQAGLDAVMRCLNERFARQGRFFNDADLQNVIAGLAPAYAGLEAFFRDYIRGTQELDYDKYLAYAGLRLVRHTRELPAPGFAARLDSQGLVQVESVEPGSGAQVAGLEAGDILLAADGQELAALPEGRLPRWEAGKVVKFKVLREGETREVGFSIGSKQETIFQVAEIPNPTADQIEIRKGWLEGETTPVAGVQIQCSAPCSSY